MTRKGSDACRPCRCDPPLGERRSHVTLAAAARLGVVVIQNPTHFPPAARARTAAEPHSLLRSLVVAGVPLTLGSDGGADEQNPFLNILLAST